MADVKLKTRLKQKADTDANWAKATTFVPLKGEYVYYLTSHKIKVGDGSTTLPNLPFIAASSADNATNASNANYATNLGVSGNSYSKSSLDNALNNKISYGATIKDGILETHPENGGEIIAYYTNDLTGLTYKGGSCRVTDVTDNNKILLDMTPYGDPGAGKNRFDGSPSYAYFTRKDKTDTRVILVKAQNSFS